MSHVTTAAYELLRPRVSSLNLFFGLIVCCFLCVKRFNKTLNLKTN